jgi:ribosomal RNA-processing protein 17
LRAQRKADLETHVKSVHAIFKEMNKRTAGAEASDAEESDNDTDASNSEWEGFTDKPPSVPKDQEYIDEDAYATVTVEAVDIDRDGFVARKEEGDEVETTVEVDNAAKLAGEGKKRVWTKEKPKKVVKKKAKVKKFRYESKTERKVTRAKERSKNTSQAKARREKDS